MEEENLEYSKGLTKADLWDIAKYIVDKQKVSPDISDDAKHFIDWDDIKDDWFDVLNEIVFRDNNI